jgi:hypothetical protein
MYPTGDQVFTPSSSLSNKAITIVAGLSPRVYKVHGQDGIGYDFQFYGPRDAMADGVKSTKTEIIELLNDSNIPYYGAYAWAIHVTDTIRGRVRNLTFNSPKWINAVEAFNSIDVVFDTGASLNGHGALNGSAACGFKDIEWDIEANTLLFQNSGHPVMENNQFFANPQGFAKNFFSGCRVNIPFPLTDDVARPNFYPVGIWDRGGHNGIRITDFEYHRGNYNTVGDGAYGQAVRVQGEGLYLDGVIATGNYGNEYLAAYGVGQNNGSSVSVSVGNGIVKNINVPTASLPIGLTLEGTITTTERPLKREPLVVCGADYTVVGDPFIDGDGNTYYMGAGPLSGTITFADSVTLDFLYWSKISGPSSPELAYLPDDLTEDVSFTGLVEGTHKFKLTVRDSQGVFGGAYTTVTVVRP